MIASLEDLKEFILWAKTQKLKSVTIGGTAFEFSELAHIESYPDMTAAQVQEPGIDKPASSPKLPDGNVQSKEDDELLFWSAR